LTEAAGVPERTLRPQWWQGPGRYLLLSGALFLLVVPRLWTDAWLGDFWVHLPAVKELAARPLHPRHPLFGTEQPYAFLSPYAWVLGVAARLSQLRPMEILILQGFVNLALLLAALYAFVATWLGRRAAAVYALLFLLLLWGRDPWVFSSVFHLRSLVFVFPYPSTLAAAVALGSLAAAPRALASGGKAWAALAVPVLAILWIVHPINAVFLCAGLLVCLLNARPPLHRWAALALIVGTSLVLAFCWPLFPMRELWFAETDLVHQGNDAMYAGALPRIAPALLGLPWLLVRLKRDPRDRLALLALILAALVAYGAAGAWSYGRLLSHLVLLLQVALADACAVLEERLAALRGGRTRQELLAPSLAALLLAASWSSAVRPTLAEAGRGDPRWLSFLESQVGRDDVVLTDLETCWYVPSFSGKVVAFGMRLPFAPDHDERRAAVARFFERGVAPAERLEIIGRYEVAYVLLTKSELADWRALLAELRLIGQVVYSSPGHELLRLRPRLARSVEPRPTRSGTSCFKWNLRRRTG
jgi:alpha-1,6-mannosyltransferase